MTLSPDELRRRLDGVPREPLGDFPTPLERLDRLSRRAGGEIWVKRDDLPGPGLGGNKTRKLEYLLPPALAARRRRLVTFGGLQSNHVRITAGAARALGLEPHLFFFERRPARLLGNLAIDEALGARLHFVPFGGGNDGGMTIETANRLVGWVARAWVRDHHFIPVGGHHWLGALGYVGAALELHEEVLERGWPSVEVTVAVGTGGTLAGLMAGLSLLDSPIRLVGIDVGRLWKRFRRSIAGLATEVVHRLGGRARFTATEVPLVDGYVGARYGVPSEPGLRAIRCAARSDGLVLDPIYTGKAFAGLLDRGGGEAPPPPVRIFVHTGGEPGLHAFGSAPLEVPPAGAGP